jgi:aspartate 1-decarboxylase
MIHRSCIVFLFYCTLGPQSGIAEETISFRSQIAPILMENCLACHGPKKAEGGYRVDSFEELQKPGDSGEALFSHPEKSAGEFLRRIRSTDAAERMPAESAPLPKEQIEILNRWVAEGSKFDGEMASDSLLYVIPPKSYPDPPASYVHPVMISAIAFSPDGKKLLASGYHEITIWNVEDATLSRRIKNVGRCTYSIVFLPDGKTIAVGGGEPGIRGEVRFFDFETGVLKAVVARSSDVILDLAIRPHSPEMAIASADSSIRLLNIESMKVTRTLASHGDWVTAVAWNDDGTRLASASRDKSVKVHDANNGELLQTYQGHGAAVRGVTFVAGGKEICSTGADNKLHRWLIEGTKKITEIGLGGEAFKLSRAEDFLITPSTDKKLRRIELSKNAISKTMSGHDDWVTSTSIHPGTNRIASGSLDGGICLWNLTDGSLVRSWQAKP